MSYPLENSLICYGASFYIGQSNIIGDFKLIQRPYWIISKLYGKSIRSLPGKFQPPEPAYFYKPICLSIAETSEFQLLCKLLKVVHVFDTEFPHA